LRAARIPPAHFKFTSFHKELVVLEHICSALLCGVISGAPASQPPRPIQIVAHQEDGCLIKGVILQEKISVVTKYGPLEIPFSDIRRIDFGFHCEPRLENEIILCIKGLSSNDFKVRDHSTKRLVVIGSTAYPLVIKATKSADLECAQRATHIAKEIEGHSPPETLRLKEEDIVYAKAFTVIGRIKDYSFKVVTKYNSQMVLDIESLTAMSLAFVADKKFTIDATRHGSSADDWFKTDVIIEKEMRLSITADGQVDLWPQGPGQYITGPKGYTTAGKGGNFMAGVLLGKVGEQGSIFVIGEKYDGVPQGVGQLFLHIVPSPWNNISTGNYNLSLTTRYANR